MRGMWLCTSMLLTALNAASAAQQGRQMGGVGILVFAEADYRGQNATFRNDVANLASYEMNDRISSLRVAPGETWEVCEHADYRGRCQVFYGDEPNLQARGWNDMISSMRRVSGSGGPPAVTPTPPIAPAPGGSGLELFDQRNFRGDRRVFSDAVPDLRDLGFNDRAQSLRLQGSQNWQVCTDAYYRGCLVVNTDWPDLNRLGKFLMISSVRPWPQGGSGVAPPALPAGAGVELFDQPNFRGDRRVVTDAIPDLRDIGFNDRAQSLRLQGSQHWEVCTELYFRGCFVVNTDWPDLTQLVGDRRLSSVRPWGQSGGGGYRPPGGDGIELFDQLNFSGDRRAVTDAVPDMRELGFDNRAQSLRLQGFQHWEVCTEPYFRGCLVVNTDWPDLTRLVGNRSISSVRPWGQGGGGGSPPGRGSGQLILYESTEFRGRAYTLTDPQSLIPDLYGSESARVTGAWQVCDGPGFAGECAVITSDVPNLHAIGLRGRVLSARPHAEPR